MKHTPAFWASMGAAATGLGVSMRVLREAKKAGCEAFRAGRVDKAEIRHWLKLHPKGGLNGNGHGSADELLKSVRAEREMLRLSRERGELLDRQAVEEAVRNCAARLLAVIEREFGSELPPVLKGLDEVGIRKKVIERLRRIQTSFRQEARALLSSS